MSELRDKVSKHVEKINDTISNVDEKSVVLGEIQEIVKDFTTYVVQLSARQNEIEEKLTDIFDILTNIEQDIFDGSADDLYGHCPYCGEEIPLTIKDGDFADIECPNCHNLIEMEMCYEDDDEMFGCGNGGCESCCGGCEDNNSQDNKQNCNKKFKKNKNK